MNRLSAAVRTFAVVGGFAAATAALLAGVEVHARDYGQQGATFPVVEPDLLAVLEGKLMAAKQSGRIDAMQKELARRTEARVRRPAPVAGIANSARQRSWLYDPTIIVEQDIRDARGIVIIPAGRKVNPLDTVPLRQSLVFVAGDDKTQMAWALRSTTATNAKIILTSGSPFELMKPSNRRLFFDQGGQLTAKFGIRAVPAVVQQEGRVLRVTELPTPKGVRA